MNVYDFDKTIYNGDSSIDFYFYCLKKQPKVLLCVFKQAYGIFLHAIHKLTTAEMKEYFFSYLTMLKAPEMLVESFWDKNFAKIKNWYLQAKDKSDLIISASPEFLLNPICKSLGIQKPIATQMDIKTGKITGENCKGKEKVKRFFEKYPNGKIESFYSDSITDSPLAELAQNAYFVDGDKLTDWVNA